MTNPPDFNRGLQSSSSEDLFVDIFQEALGFERAQLLLPQYPFQDIDGKGRSIDFVLLSRLGKYAFEIDGEVWHFPTEGVVSSEKYRDALIRQNSLIYQGWKVYRWTDVQLARERERVREQLRLFLEREISEGTLDDFLPEQQGAEISLHAHQSNAVQLLDELRRQGKTISLLTLATGTGKTHIAISDAKRLGFRTLYLAHRTDLVKQTQHRFLELWPEVTSQVFRKKSGKPDAQVVLATIQAMSDSLELFDPKEFGYIIFDEAHHVAAPVYRKVLAYFRARFILGLTATPERHDGQSLLDLFQTTAHRLELEEAISRGLLVPIRCVRVRTNVDLTHIHFNGVDYRASDLEIHLFIPDRDRLIVDTYIAHVAGKRAVCFCVNIAHAENLALEFQRQGITAAHVSGRMNTEHRQAALEKYQHGEIRVLCACDILTEGWDSPETEALFMARPTLSKVVYVQQLGRGTRKAPGKECLYVFDFIDNTTRYAQAMSAHLLLRKEKYFPGALIAAPGELLQAEDRQIAAGEKTTVHLGLHLWAEGYEPIDIFRWQDEVKDMLQAHELERELGVGQRTVRHWIEANRLQPDHTIEMGSRVYHYFKKERIAQIRADFGLVEVTSENIKQQFFEFVTEMDMSSSYKPVLLLGLLELADERGRVKVPALVQFFRTFYLNRQASGHKVEAEGKRMNKVATLTDTEIASVMLEMPFEKFERRKYLRYLKEVTVIKFQDALWKILTVEDRRQLKEIAQAAIISYYARI